MTQTKESNWWLARAYSRLRELENEVANQELVEAFWWNGNPPVPVKKIGPAYKQSIEYKESTEESYHGSNMSESDILLNELYLQINRTDNLRIYLDDTISARPGSPVGRIGRSGINGDGTLIHPLRMNIDHLKAVNNELENVIKNLQIYGTRK